MRSEAAVLAIRGDAHGRVPFTTAATYSSVSKVVSGALAPLSLSLPLKGVSLASGFPLLAIGCPVNIGLMVISTVCFDAGDAFVLG